jgi:hypothetical protein
MNALSDSGRRTMGETMTNCSYFHHPGPENTERVFQIAKTRAEQLRIQSIVVATTTGRTGVRASEACGGYNLVVVTHSAGFKEPNGQELTDENRQAMQANGAHLLTCQHAFGGVGRAVRKKLQTYELEEIIAYTLRIFGEGMKVACEITLMAADAGLIRAGEPTIAIGGTGRGADTAIVVLPANAQTFFDLRVIEVLCKPGFYPDPQ